MGRKKVSGEAEAMHAGDVALALRFDELLADAREAENAFRKAQTVAASNDELYLLARKFDVALTDVMRAAYAAARAEVGPRGYDDPIYHRKAKAKPTVHAWIDTAEWLLTLRETHRITGIPPVPPSGQAEHNLLEWIREMSKGKGTRLGEDQPIGAVPPPAGGAAPKSNATSLLIGCLAFSVAGTLGIAIYFQVSGIESSLTASTWGLALVVFLWVGSALFWGEINPPAQAEPELSPLIRSAANVVITVDGVVLGLIYTFLGANNKPIPLTVKVGALALVTGVILALLLYALVGGKITTPAAAAIATGLFSLASWALAYGLLCIVFTLVLPPP